MGEDDLNTVGWRSNASALVSVWGVGNLSRMLKNSKAPHVDAP